MARSRQLSSAVYPPRLVLRSPVKVNIIDSSGVRAAAYSPQLFSFGTNKIPARDDAVCAARQRKRPALMVRRPSGGPPRRRRRASALLLRKPVKELGVAPLSSSFVRRRAAATVQDWRPEVHDSDGWIGATILWLDPALLVWLLPIAVPLLLSMPAFGVFEPSDDWQGPPARGIVSNSGRK